MLALKGFSLFAPKWFTYSLITPPNSSSIKIRLVLGIWVLHFLHTLRAYGLHCSSDNFLISIPLSNPAVIVSHSSLFLSFIPYLRFLYCGSGQGCNHSLIILNLLRLRYPHRKCCSTISEYSVLLLTFPLCPWRISSFTDY
jgi:hypothetical protein